MRMRAVVLVIGFEEARRVGEFCRYHDVPFRCLVDEGRTAYRAYGLDRAPWSRTLTPRSLASRNASRSRPSRSAPSAT